MNDKCAAGTGKFIEIILTGGLCDSPYFLCVLSEKTGCVVGTHPFARYAGALGAALSAAKKKVLPIE